MVGIAPQEGQLHYLQIGFESPWLGVASQSFLLVNLDWSLYYLYYEYMCRFECDGSSWLGRPFAAFSDSFRLDRLWIRFPRKRLSVLSEWLGVPELDSLIIEMLRDKKSCPRGLISYRERALGPCCRSFSRSICLAFSLQKALFPIGWKRFSPQLGRGKDPREGEVY